MMVSIRAVLIALVVLSVGFPHLARPLQASAETFNIKLSGGFLSDSSAQMQISPDGNRVIYRSFTGTLATRLYSAPLDGSALPVQLSPVLLPTVSIRSFAITSDSSRVVFELHNQLSDIAGIYSVPIDGGDAVRLNGPLTNGGSVVEYRISPDDSYVLYRADQNSNDMFELYRVPIEGGTPQRLNGLLHADGDVLSFTVSPDGSRVLYRANGATDAPLAIQLYSVAMQGGSAMPLHAPLPNGSSVASQIAVTPDGARVIYIVNGIRDQLYSVPISGGSGANLTPNLQIGGIVSGFFVSPRSDYIMYAADYNAAGIVDLYSVPVHGGPSTPLNSPLPDFAELQSAQISPDGNRVVYRVDQRFDEMAELYSVPIGGGEPVRISGTLPPEGRVTAYRFSPDGSRVVYQVFYVTEGMFVATDLYSAPVGAASGSVRLNPLLPTAGEVQSFVIGSDSSRVIYLADQEANNRGELFTVAINGGNAIKLNEPLVANGDVTHFAVSPDAQTIVYYADQASDEDFELFATFESEPTAILTGPAAPLPVGESELSVNLSHAKRISGATLNIVASGGDAVAGSDYMLSTGWLGAGDAEHVTVRFEADQLSRPLIVTVLSNPQRTSARTLTLSLRDPSGALLGAPDSIVLTIPPGVLTGGPPVHSIYLPLLMQ